MNGDRLVVAKLLFAFKVRKDAADNLGIWNQAMPGTIVLHIGTLVSIRPSTSLFCRGISQGAAEAASALLTVATIALGLEEVDNSLAKYLSLRLY